MVTLCPGMSGIFMTEVYNISLRIKMTKAAGLLVIEALASPGWD
jgi:hypothetical protein